MAPRRVLAMMLAGLAGMSALPAVAQVACIPPEEPYPYAPPENDPELRALINKQYQDYMRESEEYLNCLNDEASRTRDDIQTILKRWLRYYGDEAVVVYDTIE